MQKRVIVSILFLEKCFACKYPTSRKCLAFIQILSVKFSVHMLVIFVLIRASPGVFKTHFQSRNFDDNNNKVF